MFFKKHEEKKEEPTIDYNRVDLMILAVTKGYLGKKENLLTDERGYIISSYFPYSFRNDNLYLYYFSDTDFPEYEVYYNGEFVYENKDRERKVKTNDYDFNLQWFNEIERVYKQHMDKEEETKRKIMEDKERSSKVFKIRKAFEYVYPEGYSDDKIIIDQVGIKNLEPYYSTEEGGLKTEHIYVGRVRLMDGTVVCDDNNNIHHPGMWEDYIISLLPELKAIRDYKQQLKKEEYDRKRREKEEAQRVEKQRIYNRDHSPIDDSKFFK